VELGLGISFWGTTGTSSSSSRGSNCTVSGALRFAVILLFIRP